MTATAASLPSSETIQDGSYSPLSRPLFMYPSTDALQRSEVVRRSCSTSVDNYDQIAESALIVPMDDQQAAKAQAAVAKAVG